MNTDLLMASTSSRMSEPFPAGLRVLVVDHDTTCKRLEKMLIKSEFNYQVTTCNLGREALDLIEKAEDGFDILMSTDANLTDMDGLMFVDQVVRLKRKLSIILMSVDGDKSGYRSKTIEGLRRGAYYILKPIESKDVGNLWMHVFMQRCCKYSKSIEAKESLQQAGDDDRNHEAGGESQALAPIQIENNNVDDGEAVARRKKNNNDLLVPKTRVSWNDDLHHKFLQALQQVGLNAGPKKILELMKVRGLTRDNVASHLQKFKQNLERQRKEAAKAYNNLVLSNSDNISLLQDGVAQNGMNPDSITAQFSSQNPYDQHWRHHVEEDDGYLRDTNPLNSNPEDPVNLYLNDDAQSPTSDTHNNGYLSNGNNI